MATVWSILQTEIQYFKDWLEMPCHFKSYFFHDTGQSVFACQTYGFWTNVQSGRPNRHICNRTSACIMNTVKSSRAERKSEALLTVLHGFWRKMKYRISRSITNLHDSARWGSLQMCFSTGMDDSRSHAKVQGHQVKGQGHRANQKSVFGHVIVQSLIIAEWWNQGIVNPSAILFKDSI